MCLSPPNGPFLMDGHPCFEPHFLNGVSLFPPCPPKCHTTKIRYDVVKKRLFIYTKCIATIVLLNLSIYRIDLYCKLTCVPVIFQETFMPLKIKTIKRSYVFVIYIYIYISSQNILFVTQILQFDNPNF